MIDKRKSTIVAATILFALGIGHVTQNGDAIAARLSSVKDSAELSNNTLIQREQFGSAGALPTLPMDAILPIDNRHEHSGAIIRVAANSYVPDLSMQSDVQTPIFNNPNCDVVLSVLPAPGAMVQLSLDAPCDQNQRITVAHGGLEFADITSSDGTYYVEIPALHEDAKYIVTLADGRSAEAETLMLTLHGYERVVVMWNGAPNVHIHALEFGAKFGGAGHVWADAARDPSVGVQAEGGFMTRLGNPNAFNPQLAEVYSFPYDRVQGNGAVELVVEVGVTDQSCATELTAKAMQLSGSGTISSTDISLEIPNCDGENGFLVLKNLLLDLNIAQN